MSREELLGRHRACVLIIDAFVGRFRDGNPNRRAHAAYMLAIRDLRASVANIRDTSGLLGNALPAPSFDGFNEEIRKRTPEACDTE